MTTHCRKCGAMTDTAFRCMKGCDLLTSTSIYNHPDTTKAKLIIAIDALEEIAKKATFTEIHRTATEALEKIK